MACPRALFAAIVLMLAVNFPALAQSRLLTPIAPARSQIFVPVRSFIDLRFRDVVRQTEDLSCGAAALATLLHHYLRLEAGERMLIDDMIAAASDAEREKIDQYGFSLLELKRAGERRGLVGGGFRLDSVDKLFALKAPVIALTTVRGYAHFVVIRGARDGRVFIADPAFGNRTVSARDFAKEWDGVVLTLIFKDRLPQPSAFTEDHALYAQTNTLIPIWDQNRLYVPPSANSF